MVQMMWSFLSLMNGMVNIGIKAAAHSSVPIGC
jgi:hypothetical protein